MAVRRHLTPRDLRHISARGIVAQEAGVQVRRRHDAREAGRDHPLHPLQGLRERAGSVVHARHQVVVEVTTQTRRWSHPTSASATTLWTTRSSVVIESWESSAASHA